MIPKLYLKMMNCLGKIKTRKGQTMVEYGLIMALVAIVVIGVISILGNQLLTIFGKITATLSQSSGS